MWETFNIIFNIVGLVLILQFLRFKIRDYYSERGKGKYWTVARHKYELAIGLLVLLAFVLIEFVIPEVSPLEDRISRTSFNAYLAVFTAFVISLVWAVYMRKLDIFEPEGWLSTAATFVMGAVTVWLVFPIAMFLNGYFGFRLNGEALHDFIYCVVGIGMVEEFVKILPFVVLFRIKGLINEPYDYLFYASMSALGFAFVENSLYIQNTNFYAVNGRALMASVAHMTFSSVIGYSFMISSCRYRGQGWYYVLGGFLLASLMHGFYDFWLINPTAQQFDGLSMVFFLLTTHFWFTMKNKSINASYFFDDTRVLQNDQLRFFLVVSLVSIMVASSLLIGIFHGSFAAHKFFKGQVFAFGFMIYYLSFSFSRFIVARRIWAICHIPFEYAIPKEPELRHDWEVYRRNQRSVHSPQAAE